MTDVNADTATIIEELAERIGHIGLGGWLERLGRWLGVPRPYPPATTARFFDSSGHDIEVRLHDPAWRTDATVAADSWVLYDATIKGTQHLPFGLAASVETPGSAERKLSNDVVWNSPTADGSRSITYFLADLRVVIVRFQPGLSGIEAIKLTRLFSWPDWRRHEE